MGVVCRGKNKQDPAAMRQALAPKMTEVQGQWVDTHLKQRDDFYAILTAFTHCMKVALPSKSFFDDKSFDGDAQVKGSREHYKATLKMFVNLRKQVREDANETIDYDQYNDDIRSLLDKHIAGVEVKEPEGVYCVGNMGKRHDTQTMSYAEARNQTDKITGRITKIIEQDLADDPYAQAHFSKLLKKAIAKTKEMLDAPLSSPCYLLILKMPLKPEQSPDTPKAFTDESGHLNKHAQAFFGLFKHLFSPDVLTEKSLSEDTLIDHALAVDKVVNTAVAEYSINPSEIENAISNQLLHRLYPDFGLANAERYIHEVLNITRLRISRQ